MSGVEWRTSTRRRSRAERSFCRGARFGVHATGEGMTAATAIDPGTSGPRRRRGTSPRCMSCARGPRRPAPCMWSHDRAAGALHSNIHVPSRVCASVRVVSRFVEPVAPCEEILTDHDLVPTKTTKQLSTRKPFRHTHAHPHRFRRVVRRLSLESVVTPWGVRLQWETPVGRPSASVVCVRICVRGRPPPPSCQARALRRARGSLHLAALLSPR